MTPSDPREPFLRLRDVHVSYGAVTALQGVGVDLVPGQVLALVGDNGAGKSTLVKVISGLRSPDRGTVELQGVRQRPWNPHKAREAGIETVHQDFALVDDLNLWRNFFLGNELCRRVGPLRVLRRREMARICQARLKDIGLPGGLLDQARAESLSGGERQSLAIARALYFGKKVLVLDEPVASLAVREANRVYDAIRTAASAGLPVLYIDHNMANVHAIADRVVLLRAGKIAAEVSPQTVSLAELLQLVTKTTGAESAVKHEFADRSSVPACAGDSGTTSPPETTTPRAPS